MNNLWSGTMIGIDNGTIKEIFKLTDEGIKKITEASKLDKNSFKITMEPASPGDMEDIQHIHRIEVDNGTIKEFFRITEKGITKLTTASSKLKMIGEDETLFSLTIKFSNEIVEWGIQRDGNERISTTIIG